VVDRVGSHQQVVEVPSPLRRGSLHHGQVVRPEHRGDQVAQQVAGACHPVAVDLHPTPPRCRQFHLEEGCTAGLLDLGPEDGPIGTGPDQGLGRDPAERGAGGQPGHGLDQVGLALAIVADDGGPPVAERQVDGCQVPEVGERQPPNRHRTAAPDYDTRTGISR
jgi:hypothetical protein